MRLAILTVIGSLTYAYYTLDPANLFFVHQKYNVFETQNVYVVMALLIAMCGITKAVSDVLPCGFFQLMHRRPYIFAGLAFFTLYSAISIFPSLPAIIAAYVFGVFGFAVASALVFDVWLVMVNKKTYPRLIPDTTTVVMCGMIVYYSVAMLPDSTPAIIATTVGAISMFIVGIRRISIPHDFYEFPTDGMREQLIDEPNSDTTTTKSMPHKSRPAAYTFQLFLMVLLVIIIPYVSKIPSIEFVMLVSSMLVLSWSVSIVYRGQVDGKYNEIYTSLAVFLIAHGVIIETPAADFVFYTMPCIYHGPNLSIWYSISHGAIMMSALSILLIYKRTFQKITYRTRIQISLFIILVSSCFQIAIASRRYTSIFYPIFFAMLISKYVGYISLYAHYIYLIKHTIFHTHSGSDLIVLASYFFYGKTISYALGANLIDWFGLAASVNGGCNFVEYAQMLVFASIPGITLLMCLSFIFIPNVL
jgi:hypothetical protein